MKIIMFDLETNGLLSDVTKVHLAVTLELDLQTQTTQTTPMQCESSLKATPASFTPVVGPKRWWMNRPAQKESLIQYLQSSSMLVGHNIIGFDLPALWKTTGDWETVPPVLDTLTVSRFLWPERYGGHSLQAWGQRLGNAKIEYTGGWEEANEEMMEYCEQDVLLNLEVLNVINNEYMEQNNGTPLQGYSIY